jgi:hypothetical protein
MVGQPARRFSVPYTTMAFCRGKDSPAKAYRIHVMQLKMERSSGQFSNSSSLKVSKKSYSLRGLISVHSLTGAKNSASRRAPAWIDCTTRRRCGRSTSKTSTPRDCMAHQGRQVRIYVDSCSL